ncbi:hypothetical protein, partial [Burkholderia ambifaria]|uniref:hypothetical protein n=1 Tax=Burkholderia ambifaria TaxID=152480 RepID=UPI0012FE048B
SGRIAIGRRSSDSLLHNVVVVIAPKVLSKEQSSAEMLVPHAVVNLPAIHRMASFVPTVRPFSLATKVGSPALPRATTSLMVASLNARRNSITNTGLPMNRLMRLRAEFGGSALLHGATAAGKKLRRAQL